MRAKVFCKTKSKIKNTIYSYSTARHNLKLKAKVKRTTKVSLSEFMLSLLFLKERHHYWLGP